MMDEHKRSSVLRHYAVSEKNDTDVAHYRRNFNFISSRSMGYLYLDARI